LSEEFIHAESLLVLEHEIDRPSDLMGKDTKGFSLVVFSFQFGHIMLGLIGFPEHEDGGLIGRPFQVVVPDLAVGFSGSFAIGFLEGFDQPGIG
jgi:hypothetical protein